MHLDEEKRATKSKKDRNNAEETQPNKRRKPIGALNLVGQS